MLFIFSLFLWIIQSHSLFQSRLSDVVAVQVTSYFELTFLLGNSVNRVLKWICIKLSTDTLILKSWLSKQVFSVLLKSNATGNMPSHVIQFTILFGAYIKAKRCFPIWFVINIICGYLFSRRSILSADRLSDSLQTTSIQVPALHSQLFGSYLWNTE